MNTDDVTIRSAVSEDAEQITALMKSLDGMWQDSWRDDAVSIALQSAREYALVACVDDTIVGFACFHDVGFRAYLSEIAVTGEWQRSGIGSKLLEAGEAMLLKKGCVLVVADAYPPAVPFYQKHGWGTPRSILISKYRGN